MVSKGGRGEGQESTRPQAVAPVRTHPSHNQILFQILVSSHSPDQGSQTQDHHEINERNESSVRQQGMVGTVAKWKKYVSSGGLQSQNWKVYEWACLAVQWLRICLAMQGTLVQFLIWEDPTCCGATKPVRHNY